MTDHIALEVVLEDKSVYEKIYQLRTEKEALEGSLHQKSIPFDLFSKTFKRRFCLLKDVPPLLAKKEDKVIAFVSFRPYDKPVKGELSCEISIVVDAKERGKGIGLVILEKAKV